MTQENNNSTIPPSAPPQLASDASAASPAVSSSAPPSIPPAPQPRPEPTPPKPGEAPQSTQPNQQVQQPGQPKQPEHSAKQPPKKRRSLVWGACKFLAGSAVLACALAVGAVFVWHEAAKRLPAPPLLEGVPFSAAVFSSEGRLLHLATADDGIYRLRTSLLEIAPDAASATIFYEDRRFRDHIGFDPLAMARAAFATLTGTRPIGASTLTMQIARLRLKIDSRTLSGKLQQVMEAMRYEAHYSKDQLLEAYLNLAPYGGNIEGIGAAALAYFGKPASELSPAEALALSIVPQNPVKRRPWAGPDFDGARIRVARDAVAAGVFPKRLEASLAGPLDVANPAKLPFLAPHYTRLVEHRHPGEASRGTLSLAVQRRLEALVSETIARLRPWGVRNAALAVVDSRTNALIAHVGSADFFSDAIAGEVDGFLAKRSPGSLLKTFIYGLALDQGLIHSKTVLIDSPKSFAGYAPENADGRFRGPVNATDALLASRNVPAVELAKKLRPDLYAFLQKAGANLPYPRSHYGLSIVLGGAEVSMARIASLYSMLLNGGLLRPIAVTEPEVWAKQPSRMMLSAEAAFVVQKMLEARGESISVRGARYPLLYKTGTSNGYRDAWTAGSVGPYVIVVWLGDFRGRPNAYLQGARLAAPLFREAAARLATEPSLDWPAPADPQAVPAGLKVQQELVCRATGDVGQPLCDEKTLAWFIPGKSPVRDSGVFREIWIDRETGLRACRWTPGRTERKAWEFWPTHFQSVFLAAGIVKRPPPPFEPGCLSGRSGRWGFEAAPGKPPAVVSPRAGADYFTGTAGPDRAVVILEAGTEPDAEVVYWFEGSRFIAAAPSGKKTEAQLPAGRHALTAVDDRGRASRVTVNVRTP